MGHFWELHMERTKGPLALCGLGVRPLVEDGKGLVALGCVTGMYRAYKFCFLRSLVFC